MKMPFSIRLLTVFQQRLRGRRTGPRLKKSSNSFPSPAGMTSTSACRGAAADVLRVVSQGVPTITSEKVGSYIDRAVTTYTQDRSQATDVWEM